MQDRSLVSVIIIFLNSEKYIEESMDSVLAQTYSHWELLLVDDGSSDKSTEIALRYAAQYPGKIRYLQHPDHQNRGMSASRNLGICNARGEYIAFLDSDDYWLPERLETHVRALDSHPEVGMLYGTAKYWYGWTGQPEDHERDYVPELSMRKDTLFDPPALLPLLLEGKAEVPCMCSILVRRDVVQKIEGFEESFRGMYEDQAFYAKVCLSAPVLATNDCLAWYRQYPNSSTGIASKSGRILETRKRFLDWLKGYLAEINCEYQPLLQSVRRELWLLDLPAFLSKSHKALSFVRWAKKWILHAGLYK
jgi:glycosyltransferase involved in cell wall biosynthesis